MKPQTPEEILYLKHFHFEDDLQMVVTYEDAVEVAKEHARQCVKYALEDAAENGEANTEPVFYHGVYSHHKNVVDKSSILSRYESILKELGL